MAVFSLCGFCGFYPWKRLSISQNVTVFPKITVYWYWSKSCSLKPSFVRICGRWRQSSFTFTQRRRLILQPKKRYMSSLAIEPIFFSIAPPLPIMMPLCVARSQ